MTHLVTKKEAENWLQFAEDIKEYEFSFCGFLFGDDDKYYPGEFLEAVCDNGGFVEETKPLVKEYHIIFIKEEKKI